MRETILGNISSKGFVVIEPNSFVKVIAELEPP
jgi:hypothetical protein